MQVDPHTGVVTWTPGGNQLGTYDVMLNVADGQGGSAQQAFKVMTQIAPGNHAPTIVSSPTSTALPGIPYTYNVFALDPDSDVLTYSLVAGPNGLAISPSSGQISWNATGQDLGSHEITYIVEDGRGGIDTQDFLVNVTSVQPGEIHGRKFNDLNGNGVFDAINQGLPGPRVPITLIPISTPFNSPIGIDYHSPTNSVVASVNYYSAGNPNNLELIDLNGNHIPFSKLSGLTDELKVATVRPGNAGGFATGEIFTGNGIDGQIVRISPDGETIINPYPV